ncbi:MAG: PepSY domain-containing protein [Acidimicrobiales bacterium]
MTETDNGVDARGPATDSSKSWRAFWRVHFYAGMFALPFILFMAVTGLVILYTQPIQDLTGSDVRTVEPQAKRASLDDQAAAAQTAYPKAKLQSLITPTDGGHSTIFGADDGELEIYVNPYTAKVLGSAKPGDDLVGVSNRLHGYLDNEAITVKLPTVSALWDGEAVMRPYVVGDLLLEVMGAWTLVLVLSGLYLYWPRRSASGDNGRRPGFFTIRRGVTGRARWRDVHGLSGAVLLVAMLLTIISGMAWSTYWGPNFTALANEITPNTWTDAPPSVLGRKGDLDRLGNKINWNTADRPIPASYSPKRHDGTTPAPLSLDTVAAIARREGMKPGYSINFPANVTEKAKGTTYGSFTLSNSWPRKTGEAKDVFLDQFSGKHLAEQKSFGYGSISYALDTMVSTHMGTQLGIFSRIMMTLLCVLAIVSSTSGLAMFFRRRRPGTAGLPRRPIDIRFGRRTKALVVAFGVMFPVWGASAIVILGLDRFVIRKVPRLASAFGQR